MAASCNDGGWRVALRGGLAAIAGLFLSGVPALAEGRECVPALSAEEVEKTLLPRIVQMEGFSNEISISMDGCEARVLNASHHRIRSISIAFSLPDPWKTNETVLIVENYDPGQDAHVSAGGLSIGRLTLQPDSPDDYMISLYQQDIDQIGQNGKLPRRLQILPLEHPDHLLVFRKTYGNGGFTDTLDIYLYRNGKYHRLGWVFAGEHGLNVLDDQRWETTREVLACLYEGTDGALDPKSSMPAELWHKAADQFSDKRWQYCQNLKRSYPNLPRSEIPLAFIASSVTAYRGELTVLPAENGRTVLKLDYRGVNDSRKVYFSQYWSLPDKSTKVDYIGCMGNCTPNNSRLMEEYPEFVGD